MEQNHSSDYLTELDKNLLFDIAKGKLHNQLYFCEVILKNEHGIKEFLMVVPKKELIDYAEFNIIGYSRLLDEWSISVKIDSKIIIDDDLLVIKPWFVEIPEGKTKQEIEDEIKKQDKDSSFRGNVNSFINLKGISSYLKEYKYVFTKHSPYTLPLADDKLDYDKYKKFLTLNKQRFILTKRRSKFQEIDKKLKRLVYNDYDAWNIYSDIPVSFTVQEYIERPKTLSLLAKLFHIPSEKTFKLLGYPIIDNLIANDFRRFFIEVADKLDKITTSCSGVVTVTKEDITNYKKKRK